MLSRLRRPTGTAASAAGSAALSAACSGALSPTALLRSRMTRKHVSMDPNSSDANVGNSFERMVEDVGSSMPFKPTQDMRERPFMHSNYDENPEMHHSPTSGIDAANAQLQGKEATSARVPKERYTFDKVYDPELVRKSTCSPEHYYPPPPSKAEIKRRMQVRQVWVSVVVSVAAMLFTLDRILPQLKAVSPMVGRT